MPGNLPGKAGFDQPGQGDVHGTDAHLEFLLPEENPQLFRGYRFGRPLQQAGYLNPAKGVPQALFLAIIGNFIRK